jgi:hypothetical protein
MKLVQLGSTWKSRVTGRVWRVESVIVGQVSVSTWEGERWFTAGMMRDEDLVRYADPCADPALAVSNQTPPLDGDSRMEDLHDDSPQDEGDV